MEQCFKGVDDLSSIFSGFPTLLSRWGLWREKNFSRPLFAGALGPKNGISAKLKHIQRRRLALCSNISTLAPACRTLASVEPVWPMACLSGFNRQFEHFQHVWKVWNACAPTLGTNACRQLEQETINKSCAQVRATLRVAVQQDLQDLEPVEISPALGP